MSQFIESRVRQLIFNFINQDNSALANEALETIGQGDAEKVKSVLLNMIELTGNPIPTDHQFKKYIKSEVKRLIEGQLFQEYYSILMCRHFMENKEKNISQMTSEALRFIPSQN